MTGLMGARSAPKQPSAHVADASQEISAKGPGKNFLPSTAGGDQGGAGFSTGTQHRQGSYRLLNCISAVRYPVFFAAMASPGAAAAEAGKPFSHGLPNSAQVFQDLGPSNSYFSAVSPPGSTGRSIWCIAYGGRGVAGSKIPDRRRAISDRLWRAPQGILHEHQS